MTLVQVHMTVIMTTNNEYWDIGNNSFAAVLNIEQLLLDHDLLENSYLKYSFLKL